MPPPLNAGPSTTQLLKCPRCDYSLQGLPTRGRCPECGFVYDEHTIVLIGIARGMSTTSPGRALLWIFVVGCLAFGPNVVSLFLFVGGGTMAIVSLSVLGVWLVALIYLLTTGKKEKKGMEPFLFAADGFGSCDASDIHSPESTFKLTSWDAVNSVHLQRLGKTWHRLRIGWSSVPGSPKMSRVALDAGVRCDENQARMVRYHLERRISLSRGEAVAPPALPKPDYEELLDLEDEKPA